MQPETQLYRQTHPLSGTGCLQAFLIAALLGWLSAAPIAAMAAVSAAVGYAPDVVGMFEGVATPGRLPLWATGALAAALTWAVEMMVFAPAWLLTRQRAGWEWLGGASAGLAAISTYQALWAVGGIPFHDKPVGTAALRLALTWPFLLAVVLASRSRQAFQRPALSTLLLALGAAACLLVPWLVWGALGTTYFTAASLLRALVNGVGEEIVFRGLLMFWLTRATRRPWLAALVSILAYSAAQCGYVLPLGDWFVLARVGIALVVGLIAAEMFARGSLWPAMVVHIAFEFGPLALADWRMRASLPHPAYGTSLLLAAGLGLALWLGRWVWNGLVLGAFTFSTLHILRSRLRAVYLIASAGFAVLAWAAALGAYIAWGHPGFYQDSYLIILKEQANVSRAYTIADRAERIGYVYATLTETAERTQKPIRAELDRRGVKYRPYYLINMIRVDSSADLSFFARRDDVAQVIVNPNVRETGFYEKMFSLTDKPGGAPWNIRAVKADQVWEKLGVTGQGIVVAGADTGVDWTHPAIQSRYRGWDGRAADHNYNWYDPWDDNAAPTDDVGHGTHTIGTVLGDDGQGGHIGVAPGAQWIACRNMRVGLGNPGAYVACMEFFLAPFPLGGDPFRDGRPELAPHVVNNSWGCPDYEGCAPDTLERAVENLRAAGIMMVVSAGNDGPRCGTLNAPAAIYDASFTVGAERASGQITSFSSRGPVPGAGLVKPDVTAPGYDVMSAVPGGGYVPSPGTSMAGPHVAGLVALLWSANPSLIGDIDRTEDIIRRTAQPRHIEMLCDVTGAAWPRCGCGDDAPGKLPNNVYGYGLIDALRAVEEALK